MTTDKDLITLLLPKNVKTEIKSSSAWISLIAFWAIVGVQEEVMQSPSRKQLKRRPYFKPLFFTFWAQNKSISFILMQILGHGDAALW